MKQKILFLTLILFLYSFVAYGQRRYQDTDQQIERFSLAKSIYFNYDLHTFLTENPDSFQNYVSISFVNDLLQFVKNSESKYTAKLEVTFSILNEEDELLESQFFRKEIVTDDFKTTNSKSTVNSYYHTFPLNSGKYKLLIELSDLDTRKSLMREEKFELNNLGKKRFTLCKPKFFSRTIPQTITVEPFEKSQETFLSNFVKGSSLIVSPFKIKELEQYRITSPFVLYHEIFKEKSQDTLQVEYRLIDKNNKIEWRKTSKIHEPNLNKIGKTIEIDPGDYSPGYYNLQIAAKFKVATERVQVQIHFNPTNINSLVENSANYSPVFDEFGALQYIIDKQEYEYLISLNVEEQKLAVEDFWKERNSSGELRKEFIRRIRFSNQNFVSLIQNNPGWKTDQGRTYIVYGPTDEILHPQSPNSKYQHEIWVYNKLEQNRRFIFVFKPEEGEYILLRSE